MGKQKIELTNFLCRNIKNIRKATGMSSKDFWAKLGVGRPSGAAYENFVRVDTDLLFAISQMCGLTMKEILTLKIELSVTGYAFVVPRRSNAKISKWN